MAAFLEADSISKEFAGRRILHAVTLQAREKEMLCILGPSGCGKTTLLRCIAGLERPDSGRILLRGSDITDRSPEKRRFGFVFQNYALFPNLNVADNVGYGLRGPDWPHRRRKERVEELLELVGLSRHAGHYPAQLSGGQQQRVALVRALAPGPSLLLLDEPLSALDAQVRAQLREDLRAVQRKLGITAILVTHDQQEALGMADRIVVMRSGRIEQVAEPEYLYMRPATRFVAEFIGAMNILSLPGCREGRSFGIRYEDVRIAEATELSLRQPHTLVARVDGCRLFGAFRRVELVLSDQVSKVYADIPESEFSGELAQAGRVVALTLPEERWRLWEEE